MTTTTKKITRATFKSFVSRQFKYGNLYHKQLNWFDGMVDCVMPVRDSEWKECNPNGGKNSENTLALTGIWLVGSSRDYFTSYADENYVGYEVSNSCGNYLIAMKRNRPY